MKPAYTDLGNPDDIFQASYVVKFDKDGITTNRGEFFPLNKSEFKETTIYLGAEVFVLNRADYTLRHLGNSGILGIYVDFSNWHSYVRVFPYNPNIFVDCSDRTGFNTLGLTTGEKGNLVDIMLWHYQDSSSAYYTTAKQTDYLKDYYQKNKAYLQKLFFIAKGQV